MLTAILKKTLLFMIAMLLSSVLHATPLPDFEASYQLNRGSLRIGTMVVTLKTDKDGNYRYQSRSWPVRWISWLFKDKLFETSHGRIIDGQIWPNRYHYLRTGGSREREAILSFDWDNMTVENNIQDSPWKMDIPEGTLDKLVAQLGMMFALAGNKTEITFRIADGGKLKEYRFKVLGHETLELPAGRFDTIKVTKLRNNKKRETYIWCAPQLNYLPVRIWQREKDEAIYQSDLENFAVTAETERKQQPLQ